MNKFENFCVICYSDIVKYKKQKKTKKLELYMSIKEWIIKKLEKDIEATAGHINLEELNQEEINVLFSLVRVMKI